MSNGISNGVTHSESSLATLSSRIAKDADKLTQYLEINHLPQPSYNDLGQSRVLPSDAPQDVASAQQSLVSAALEIVNLANGPSEFLPNFALGFQYIACITWLCQFNIFHLVPLDGSISYTELSASAHVPEQRLKSMIRMAMTNAIFREQPDGKHVLHSGTSALLARDPDVYTYATYMCTRSAPMALKMADAHAKWGPDTARTYETAYNVAFDTDLPFFDHIARDKARMNEFAAYMRQVRSNDGLNFKHLVVGFAWQNIREGGLVVDVGGSVGGAAIALAQKFPHLSFIVQDFATNVDNGRKSVTESQPVTISSRVTFQDHDFTKPQPVIGANVYLLRMILHDWHDVESIRILKNLVLAMGTHTRILIMDTVLPKPGTVPVSVERIARARDLTMLQAFNSNERDLDDWKKLLSAADERLELINVTQPFGSAMSVLEIKLRS